MLSDHILYPAPNLIPLPTWATLEPMASIILGYPCHFFLIAHQNNLFKGGPVKQAKKMRGFFTLYQPQACRLRSSTLSPSLRYEDTPQT